VAAKGGQLNTAVVRHGGGFVAGLLAASLVGSVFGGLFGSTHTAEALVSGGTGVAQTQSSPSSSIASAIVGEWSCPNQNGTVTRERYFKDGQYSWRTSGNANGEAPIDRAGSELYGSYQLSGSKLTFITTRLRIQFAATDAGSALSIASTGDDFKMVGPNEIEKEMQGSGGSADVAITGSNIQIRMTSRTRSGVESSIDDAAIVTCPLLGGPSITASAPNVRLSVAMPAKVVPGGMPPKAADPSATGAEVVQAFYSALGRGDGDKANSLMSLEKRAAPAYQPDAIEVFYGHMTEPLTLVSVSAAGATDYEVGYRYRKKSAVCNGRAIVTVQQSDGHNLISRIRPLGNC